MTDIVIRLPYTAQEIQDLLSCVASPLTALDVRVANNVTLQGGQGIDIDLSEYLPDDNFAYECWFNFIGNSNGVASWMSGNNGEGKPIQYLTKVNSNNAGNNALFRSVIGSSRKVHIFLEQGTSSAVFTLFFDGYRKAYPL